METMESFQQVLRPFRITCFIMGLGVYPLKEPNSNSRWIIYLSILYSLIFWFAYAFLFCYIVTLFTWKLLYTSIVFMIVTKINIFTTIISIIMNFYHQKKFEICMKKLTTVDDTLEELGTPKMYKKMYIKSKRVIIGWIAYSLALNFYDSIWWLNLKETASWGLFLAHIANHCYQVNMFMDLLFIFFLWNIGNRFEEINKHMQCLLVKEEHGLKHRKKPMIAFYRYMLCTNNFKRTLWTLMHLHLELCRIARDLNLIFGTQMTFEMASYFMYITYTCYSLFSLESENHRYKISIYIWFTIIFWSLVFLIRLYLVNYICENVMLKANKIYQIIYQLTNVLRYTDVWKEIYQFTLQSMHQPLKFTGMGLFYFGNRFLRKFYMKVLTFVIIMVQMKTPLTSYMTDNTFIKKRLKQ